MKNKGFLMVTMEPPSSMEEEFNEWYDTEHVPERIAVKGFETAQRYVCTSGFPRYMAAYDLNTPEILAGKQYKNISGEKFSPWSKRILNKVKGLWRVTGEQIYPGHSRATTSQRLTLLHYQDISPRLLEQFIQEMRDTYEKHDLVRGLRIIQCHDNHRKTQQYVVLVEGNRGVGEITGPALEGKFRAHLVLCNEYARYWPYSLNDVLDKAVKD